MTSDIHRLLDEAFAGIEMTPDAQDLKEEIRANLLARAEELQDAGAAPGDAARRATAELGDVRELLGAHASASRPGHDLHARHRVRPKTGFVVRAVVWSLAAVLGIVVATLGATGVLPLPAPALIPLLGAAATGIGLLVGDALAQETTTSHPMPSARAGGYGLAALLAVFGLGFAGLVALQALPLWAVVFAVLGVVAAVILFAFLGASQTNRHKPWVREYARTQVPANRFEEEPETAARFGIYTVVIWIVGFGVFLVLGFVVGWGWAALALLGALAVMMIVLARMLFGPRSAP